MDLKTLFLLDGSQDVQDLRDAFSQQDNIKLITFDFYGHKQLVKQGISHGLVEDYISKEDQEYIDNKVMNLTVNWYKKLDREDILKIEGINLGWLLEIEISNYFFRVLKRFLGIKRVIEIESPHKIISSSLSNFVSCISKNKKIETKQYKSKSKQSSLYFDSIEIPISFGSKTKSLKISRSKYLRIKKLSESFTTYFSNTKLNLRENLQKKAIILLDFNPVLYPELLNELSRNHENVLLLNQRRPAMWNRESFKIVKN